MQIRNMRDAATDPETHPRTSFRKVNWPNDLETVRRLFQEYRQWLADHRAVEVSAEPSANAGLALVDELIAGLPGAYGPPRGEVLLWFEGKSLVACGALRELDPGVGEIKRISVRADHRGKGFGPRFVRALIERAHELKYHRLRVDTLATMSAAIEFYQELGFRPIPAFWPHPAAGALCFELELGGRVDSTSHRAGKPKRA